MNHTSWFPVLGTLAAITLDSTAIAILLETYFGRTPMLALAGQILAAIGAGGYVMWLIRRR